MEEWKATMGAANTAFDAGDDVRAERLYRSACAQALLQLGPAGDMQGAMVASAVSYQNLADLYFRRGDNGKAVACYADLTALLNGVPERAHWVSEDSMTLNHLRQRLVTDLVNATRKSITLSRQASDLIQSLMSPGSSQDKPHNRKSS